MYKMHKIFVFVLMVFLVSCSSEKPSGIDAQKPSDAVDKSREGQILSQPGSSEYALEIYPKEASRRSELSLRSKGIDLAEAKLEWLINGWSVNSAVPNKFKPIDTKKGDKIQAKATIKDKEVLSNIITIKNAPPEISSIKIMPEVFKAGDTLYVDVSGTDADGDNVNILYEWTRNGEPAGNNKQIGSALKRGDKVTIKITPFDGESYGVTAVLNREIKNMPPVIIDDKKFDFDGKTYSFNIKAVDPDGDTLTYSLKNAPAGMTIGPSNGAVRWNVPPDFKGQTTITASVTDGQGGEAKQDFIIKISTEIQK
jgi:hypothetical protein